MKLDPQHVKESAANKLLPAGSGLYVASGDDLRGIRDILIETMDKLGLIQFAFEQDQDEPEHAGAGRIAKEMVSRINDALEILPFFLENDSEADKFYGRKPAEPEASDDTDDLKPDNPQIYDPTHPAVYRAALKDALSRLDRMVDRMDKLSDKVQKAEQDMKSIRQAVKGGKDA